MGEAKRQPSPLDIEDVASTMGSRATNVSNHTLFLLHSALSPARNCFLFTKRNQDITGTGRRKAAVYTNQLQAPDSVL